VAHRQATPSRLITLSVGDGGRNGFTTEFIPDPAALVRAVHAAATRRGARAEPVWCCGWGIASRPPAVGTHGSARFALAAIARVGQAIALTGDEVTQALFEAVLPWEAAGGRGAVA
jgi:hypothetical protein